MSLADRVESLKAKHAALDQAIDDEIRRLYPDNLAVKQMKLEKLRIKDELSRIVR